MLFPRVISFATVVALMAASCVWSWYIRPDAAIWNYGEQISTGVQRLNRFLDQLAEAGYHRPPPNAAQDFFNMMDRRGFFTRGGANELQAREWNFYYQPIFEQYQREQEAAARAAARAAQEEREAAARAAQEEQAGEHASEDPAVWAAALSAWGAERPQAPRRSRWWRG
ncbi:uncharacterized protein UTRI_10135 [Ustilago trichophora]|uniref:Uncharacterized protein n=1 Tax=Ustilago trichophora TaxID=86804 RepID=A0A5C3E2T7_9BASI|nr:uncharacterized protein UTRI_10135 [Ustilago trichophora]